MPIHLREPFEATVPEGAIIGVVGLAGSGRGALLRRIVEQCPGARLIAAGDQLQFPEATVIGLDGALDNQDALSKSKWALMLERARRGGATIFLSSHDEALLARLADEVWWMNDNHLADRGDPRQVLARYRGFVATRLSEAGRSFDTAVDVSTRRGDGRVEVVNLETLDFAGASNAVLRSGETAAIRATLQFREQVDAPVVGIMIRTRVGFEVYGTNTQLEGVALGPVEAGATVQLEFRFRCELCPGDYTVTVASHDADGTPHDWLDDAIAFSVADSRYTAGVANLRATVQVL